MSASHKTGIRKDPGIIVLILQVILVFLAYPLGLAMRRKDADAGPKEMAFGIIFTTLTILALAYGGWNWLKFGDKRLFLWSLLAYAIVSVCANIAVMIFKPDEVEDY